MDHSLKDPHGLSEFMDMKVGLDPSSSANEWIGGQPIAGIRSDKILKSIDRKLLSDHTGMNYGIGIGNRSHIRLVPFTDKKSLTILYGIYTTRFGEFGIASAGGDICYAGFKFGKFRPEEHLRRLYPDAELIYDEDVDSHCSALNFIETDEIPAKSLTVSVRGTPFQLAVWNELLKIPLGSLTTYGRIAEVLGNPKASRGVGNAVGRNPVSYLIPCHRVICGDGGLGGYYWGTNLKLMILSAELKRIGIK
ncbi:MAG: methylated-DNA--[protein]-cysteine S-methyltransferase [Rikenellaceae bacterium]|nr:methylated-DNA--[protein]-cysteine S-methyltransferase [Rikenellaceae bacterium]